MSLRQLKTPESNKVMAAQKPKTLKCLATAFTIWMLSRW